MHVSDNTIKAQSVYFIEMQVVVVILPLERPVPFPRKAAGLQTCTSEQSGPMGSAKGM